MKRIFFALTLILVLPSMLFASNEGGTRRPMSIRDLLSIKNIGQIAVSNSGSGIAFTVISPDFRKSKMISHIYIVADGKAIPFTWSEEGERAPRWSPSGEYLAFLSLRGEDEDGGSQLWIMRAAGGEARKITDEPEGVSAFDWTPDGRSVVYLCEESLPNPVDLSKKALKERKIDARVRDRERLNVLIRKVDIESKTESTLYRGDPGIEGLSLSPDGKYAAFTSNKTGDPDDENKRNIYVLNIRSHSVKQVTREEGCRTKIAWTPDGSNVLYMRFSEPQYDFSRGDLFKAGINDGATRNLTGSQDIEVEDFSVSTKSGDILFAGAEGVSTPIFRISGDSGAIEKLTNDDANYSKPRVSGDGKVIAAREDSKSAPELYLIAPDGKHRKISDLNPRIARLSLAPQEVVRWKSNDGKEIEGILTKPLNYESGRKYPLIVIIHGGPYGRVVNTIQDRDSQPLAGEGYAIFAPNYRGSMGYGKAFSMEIRENIMDREFQDVLSGIDRLVSDGIADPERIGITGGSYGGYMTNWALATSTRFKAGVALYGVASLIGDAVNSVFPSFEQGYIGKWHWESMEPYLKKSPLFYVQDVKAPLLLLHGDDDTNTYPSNSQEMYTALKMQGKVVELVEYPREGHGFEEPNHLIDAYERTLEWFDRYLLGESDHYRPGGEIRNGDKILRITSMKTVNDYSGVTSKERFFEVNIVLEGYTDPACSLNSDVYVLTDDGRKIYPSGIPARILGETVLLKGRDLSYRLDAEKEDPGVLPISVTFEIPESARVLRLVVKDFPPVKVKVPEE